MKAALRRWLLEHRYGLDHGSLVPIDIGTHPAFIDANANLCAKNKILRDSGKGFKPNKADALTSEDLEVLWSTNTVGLMSPIPLARAVWLGLQLQFCFRGNQEAMKLRWKHLSDIPAQQGQVRMLIYHEHYLTKNNKKVCIINRYRFSYFA
jgi:hypothetical protein